MSNERWERIYKNPTKNVKELIFSPDNKYLVTKIEDITNRKCSLHIWNLEDGQEINRIPKNYTLFSLTFSADGEYLAAGSTEQITYVWNFKTGQETARIKHKQVVQKVSFSPIIDFGKPTLATATKTVQIWQLDRSPTAMRFSHNAIGNQNNRQGILFDAKFSTDSRYLATAGENCSVVIWETAIGSVTATLNHSYPVKTVFFSPSGAYIITASDFQTLIWAWRENAEKPLKQIENNCCGIFSPDDKYMATASSNIVKIWDWINDTTADCLTEVGEMAQWQGLQTRVENHERLE